MKITIDTKEDSKEEIKKIVDFLHTLIAAQQFQNTPTETSGDMFNMFGQPQEEQTSQNLEQSTDEEEPVEEMPEIKPY